MSIKQIKHLTKHFMAGVWICHILYFAFRVKTISKEDLFAMERREKEEADPKEDLISGGKE